MSDGDTYTARGPVTITWSEQVGALVAQLPHQCDRWVIGGVEEVWALFMDLAALMPHFDHPEQFRHVHICQRCGGEYYREKVMCPEWCSSKTPGAVCPPCFYPAQEEQRSTCRAVLHPRTECTYPLCLRCGHCALGCRCEP